MLNAVQHAIERDVEDVEELTRRTSKNHRQNVDSFVRSIAHDAWRLVDAAQRAAERDIKDAEELTRRASTTHRRNADLYLQSITHDAWRLVDEARTSSEIIMREITSQGPQKTLHRGFVIARDENGLPLTTAAAARTHEVIELQFSDDSVPARIVQEK